MESLTTLAKRSILDIWEGCKYAYVIYDICILNRVKREHIPYDVFH